MATSKELEQEMLDSIAYLARVSRSPDSLASQAVENATAALRLTEAYRTLFDRAPNAG